MTSQTISQADRLPPASKNKAHRVFGAGLAAAFLLSCSPVALHAEVSNSELAKEIAELKAQIRSLKGGVAEARKEARHKTTVVAAPAYVPPPAFASIPPGATPVYATADKKMIFGGLTITPGGFVDMYGIARSKNLSADTNSPLTSIPTFSNNNAHVGEARLSARNSRVALLVEAPISKTYLVSGYGELDFRAAGTTSSPGQTNNFVPRVRQLYVALDNNDYGMHVLAGQAWSLITANSKGITPRNEVLPPTLDNVVLPGYDYSRTPQIRLVKDFGKKLWLGLSLENPQTGGLASNGLCGSQVANGTALGTANGGVAATAGGGAFPTAAGVTGLTCTQAAGASTDFGGTGTTQNVTLNKIPNVIGKIAYEARIADRDVHLEALGMFKMGTTYVNYGANGATATNALGFVGSGQSNTPMGGVGANIVLPIVVGKLDFQAGGEYGTGFGYYTSSGLADATVEADGKIHAMRGESAYAGAIAHVTPAIDVYAYAGLDQISRKYSTIGGVQVGYGITTGSSNAGCNIIGGTCQGVNHRVWQLTGGFSDKLYKGYFGEVRAAAQYSFTERDLFATQANAASPLIGARAQEHIVMTSLKYFPFQ